MYSNPRKLNEYRNKTVSISTIALWLIVGLSFFLHLFTVVFSGYAYAVLLAVFTLIYIVFRKIVIVRGNNLLLVWALTVAVVFVSFLNSQRSNGALLDVIVFFCGLLLFLPCSCNVDIYNYSISLIKDLSLFFAIGVVVQAFMPTVYNVFLAIFPSAYRMSIISNGGSGFTLNTGYSAGYIIAGVIAVISDYDTNKPVRLKKVILPLFLFLALILTGKRGPALFIILTLVYVYLAPARGSKKLGRYWKIFMIIFVAIIAIWAFRDFLSQIPFIGRILNSIVGAIEGEDITSGRTRLYVWALELFKRNLFFGIGWGRFRTTVVGNVTLVKELETHNIYLQLLAETGIIGFVVFMTTFILFWNSAKIAYCDCVQNNNGCKTNWQNLLYFSFTYQTYFLLYGLTGNPLYDPHFQLMYIFSCMIIVAYVAKNKIKNSNVKPGE